MKTKEEWAVYCHAKSVRNLLKQAIGGNTLLCTKTAELTDAAQGMMKLLLDSCGSLLLTEELSVEVKKAVVGELYLAFKVVQNLNTEYFDNYLDDDFIDIEISKEANENVSFIKEGLEKAIELLDTVVAVSTGFESEKQ